MGLGKCSACLAAIERCEAATTGERIEDFPTTYTVAADAFEIAPVEARGASQ